MCVCLSVCPRACPGNHVQTSPHFQCIGLYVACCRSSVLIRSKTAKEQEQDSSYDSKTASFVGYGMEVGTDRQMDSGFA